MVPKTFLTPRILQLGCLFILASTALGAAPDFGRDVLPILSDNCFRCHGPDAAAREADLRLDTPEGMGLVIDVAAPLTSTILARIDSDDPESVMPPRDTGLALSADQRGLLREWVVKGGKWARHWAFEAPLRPPLPIVQDRDWPRNAIDYFILARLEQEQLRPNPPAAAPRLLRRVSFDLTGLPPSVDRADTFLASAAQDQVGLHHARAYSELVEELLASPRFGERMGMDWLDVARYADTNGYQGDRERTMWPWRDWVVRSLNQNQPYNDFTVNQIAGDLLPAATFEQQLATGFCRNHMINGEGGRIPEENRVEYIFDQIETVSTVWLGLTMQCCRCHDHKFDPVAQRDYFQLFAYFNRTPVNGGGGDGQTAPVLDAPTTAQQLRLSAVDEAFQQRAREIRAKEQVVRDMATEPIRTLLDVEPPKRNAEQWQQLEVFAAPHDPAYAAAAQNFRTTRQERDAIQKQIPRVMVMQDLADSVRETFILEKGLYNQPREPVTVGVPKVVGDLGVVQRDRLSLARWLVDPTHPLTARVTVNRVWQSFFGVGLVRTVEDFGVQGEKPSHPELLDWLAVEFVQSGWDIKHLVRLIVTSATYQQSAAATQDLWERDPENRWLARGPRNRLPAWMIRDQALAASGMLVDEMGGPAVKPYQPAGVWAEATFGNTRYQPDNGAALYRRSLYVFWRRIVGPTFFFDSAKRQTCSVRTTRTNTPLHALVTLNDTTYVEAARKMAERAMRERSGDAARLDFAFRLATTRPTEPEELTLLMRRLDLLRSHYRHTPEDAHALVTVGESRTDSHANESEVASLAAICLTILNLDESLSR